MFRWEKKHDVNSAICINLTILRQVRAGSSVLIAGLKINFTRRDDSLYECFLSVRKYNQLGKFLLIKEHSSVQSNLVNSKTE